MSKDEKETSGQPDQNSSGENNQETEQEAKVSRDSFLKAVSEKKSWQTKARDLEAKLKEIEEKQLSEGQEFKTLYEKTKKELDENKTNSDKAKKLFAYKVFEREATEVARQKGADERALKAILKAGDFSEVEIDYDTFEINRGQLEEAITKMQKDSPFFFTKKASAPKDVSPGNGGSVGGKPLSELTKDEIIQRLRSGEFKD